VAAGLVLLEPMFREISRPVVIELVAGEGDVVEAGQPLAFASGPAHALLTGERLALNFLQRLSGIATLTASFVKAVAGTRAEVFDTRKTTPGLRLLEKYAVRVGGGHNHRMGLYDQILIKDNHLKCLAGRTDVESLTVFVKRLRSHLPEMLIEVEVESMQALEEVLEARVDVILLDNMIPSQLVEAVRRARAHRAPVLLECSGGVTLESVAELAATGVDRISIGRLTHSAAAVDIAADLADIQQTRESS
jgi:nicotinate-nucleotide pyrophosphorylase (carboxylating)